MNFKEIVIVKMANAFYPSEPFFHPSKYYPEYSFKEISTEDNPVYEAVRECFHLSGLDNTNFGTK